MKLLNKIILSVLTLSIANNALATALPPFSNSEIKEYADILIKKDLHQSAKKYYLELGKRGDKVNSTWGLALVNLRENKNIEALKKINYLLSLDKVDSNKLNPLKAEILINLAEESYENKQTVQAQMFLNQYFKDYKNLVYNLKHRANNIKAKIENRDYRAPIKIGVILPLSGKLANIGTKIQNSLTVALYQEGMNNISLYFEDNMSTQEGSITAASKLLNHNPSLFIGPVLRDNVLAANTVISATQKPIFSFSNDQSIAGKNIFLNNVNLMQEALEITKFAYDAGNFKMACVTPKSTFGDIQQQSFIKSLEKFNGGLTKCSSFDPTNIDITKALKDLLDINKNENIRKAKLRKLEKQFERLGNAMPDDKIAEMEKLKLEKNMYDVNFTSIFLPAPAKVIPAIAPQLAYYDIDFSNNVLFLGTSSWDNQSILRNKGEHLHFSRFLSLKTKEFKSFENSYNEMFGKKPNILSGFSYDILKVAQEINFNENFYSQIYRPYGFSVLTGNVTFKTNNVPLRTYGVSKISRRSIKPITQASHQKPISLPQDLSIEKAAGLGGWFGF